MSLHMLYSKQSVKTNPVANTNQQEVLQFDIIKHKNTWNPTSGHVQLLLFLVHRRHPRIWVCVSFGHSIVKMEF